MNDYEASRLEKIKRNNALLADLRQARSELLPRATSARSDRSKSSSSTQKRKLINPPVPTRKSARTASKPLSYNEDAIAPNPTRRTNNKARRFSRTAARAPVVDEEQESDGQEDTPSNTVKAQRGREILEQSRAWEPAAAPPTRDHLTGRFAFSDHPVFQPNKSPAEILQEGAFGGTYFRTLYSRQLGVSIDSEPDIAELPADWIARLNTSKYLSSTTYDPEVNKFGVACGQSIEEWEAAGWIVHAYDPRGWFQWYARFFQGRRCDDDERQIGRWARCVGATGRWRRTLLKRYRAAGVRTVADEGEEADDAEGHEIWRELSPVVHQTCHHWAFEVRQVDLDDYWRTGK